MKLSVATINLQNLGLHSEGQRLQRLTQLIADGLGAPDVVALQEVAVAVDENTRGPVSAAEFYRTLCQGLTSAGQDRYLALEVPPLRDQDGGHPGCSIRSALLYRSDTLTLATNASAGSFESAGLTANPARILATHPAYAGDPLRHWRPGRKPLLARFTCRRHPVLVVCCHLKSMRGDTRTERQQAKKQRQVQADALAGFIKRLTAAEPDLATIVLGDMNDTPGSKTLEILKDKRLYNLLDTLPKRTRYTMRHGGKPQALDHILVSPPLQKDARTRILHLNTDGPANQRYSDHDPVVAEISV